jgi:hypothetical protein
VLELFAGLRQVGARKIERSVDRPGLHVMAERGEQWLNQFLYRRFPVGNIATKITSSTWK